MQKQSTSMASEFWFYSQLHRLGFEAFITLGNTKAIDIALKLPNGKMLTFDVKSKLKFGGSFMDLSDLPIDNHFFAFVDLKTSRDKNNKIKFPLEQPDCYIIESKNISKIAAKWRSNSTTRTGFGFIDKLLWYLKNKNEKSITPSRINEFMKDHKISKIDFDLYDKIILTFQDLYDKYQ